MTDRYAGETPDSDYFPEDAVSPSLGVRLPQYADAVAAAAVLSEADAGHPAAAEQIAIEYRIDGLDRRELEALVTLYHVGI